jgi:hypothetical protein
MAVDQLQELPPGTDVREIREWLNKLFALCRAARIVIDPDGGLEGVQTPDGLAIAVTPRPEWWGKLTYGSGANYSWVEVTPTTPSGLVATTYKGYAPSDPARGTVPADPAVEVNGQTGVDLGTIHRMTRDHSAGRVSFRAPDCGS